MTQTTNMMHLVTTEYGDHAIVPVGNGEYVKINGPYTPLRSPLKATQDQPVPMHDLSPLLLMHPDFQAGVAEAVRHFPKFYELEPLTEDEMIDEVETNLSRSISADETSYLYRLGYAYGIINTGLSASVPRYDPPDYDLSALVAHPDFLQGASLAQDSFLDFYAPAPLDPDEMITEVEDNLGRVTTKQSREATRALGGQPFSYIHALGFVFGTINEGLTYSYTIG